MTDNNNDNDTTTTTSARSPKETLLRHHKEYKLNMNIMGTVESETKRPGDFFELSDKEMWAFRWEWFQQLAWGKGLISGLTVGIAGTFLTRRGISFASRLYKIHPVVKDYSAVPSVFLATFTGTAVTWWNRNDEQATLNAAKKLPLLPGHSSTMNEYCPLLFRWHTMARMNDDEEYDELLRNPEMQVGKLVDAMYHSCVRRLAYQEVLRRQQGLGKDDALVSIPEPGVPAYEELEQILEESEGTEETIFELLVRTHFPEQFVNDQEDDSSINKAD